MHNIGKLPYKECAQFVNRYFKMEGKGGSAWSHNYVTPYINGYEGMGEIPTMKEFLIHSIIVIMSIAMFIGLFVMDKWLGPFWSLLLGLVLFMAFIIGIIFVVGKTMGEVNKYRSEVEMEEEMK